MQEDCHYNGSLTYWDWTLDWQDVLNAPVWGSGDLAFGTDGKPGNGPALYHGYCVQDGAFAGLTLRYSNRSETTHCLSRGFVAPPDLNEYTSRIRPQAVENLLLEPNQVKFDRVLEERVHFGIPRIVRGDFSASAAPNGEFLHCSECST